MILINALIGETEDYELRMHIRTQMESSNIREIMEACKAFGLQNLDRQIGIYEQLDEEDRERMMELFDRTVLQDMSDPTDVYNAILKSVDGTPAYKFFLSAMQHLLLIREEPEIRSRYYQLIDKLVTTIVLDKKPNFEAGLQGMIGVSVARLVAQFNEQDRLQVAEDEAGQARSLVLQLELEKEALEKELNQGANGLVGDLKGKLSTSEGKVESLRTTVNILQTKVEAQKRDFEEKLNQLEAQIMEMFKMLREASTLEDVIDGGGGMDRKALIETLERQFQRKKTVGILEGREPDIDEFDFAGDVSQASISGRAARASRKPRSKRKEVPTDLVSQFMDAEEENVQAHMESTQAEGNRLLVGCIISYNNFLLILSGITILAHRFT
jgi:cytokinesis protein